MLSNKCKKVLDMVREHYDQYKADARILIFVDMRRTARKLCHCLENCGNFRIGLNPRVIVGRGICGDGLTIDEQQEILNDFRRGSTRLLVTTTVLEEGLDVPSCNMVLRMAAPDNLRQFVQSRGRACRVQDGKFCIICKSKEEAKHQQLFLDCMQRQATVIKEMMKPGRCELGQLTEFDRSRVNQDVSWANRQGQHEKPKLLDQEEEENEEDEEALQEMIKIMMNDDVGPEEDDLRFLDEEEPEEAFMPVKFAIFADDDEDYQLQVEELKNSFDLFCPEAEFSDWTDIITPGRDKLGTRYSPEVNLVEALTETTGRDGVQRVEKKILELIMSDAFEGDTLKFWMAMCTPKMFYPRSTAPRFSLHQTYVGSFRSPKEFVERMALGTASHLRLDRASDKIVITVNDRFRIESSFSFLQHFAVVDRSEETRSQEALMHLYLTFTQPPRLSETPVDTSGEQTTNRAFRLTRYSEQGSSNDDSRTIFSNCLTYKLEIPNPITKDTHYAIDPRIRQLLRVLEGCGITIYYGRVHIAGGYGNLPTENEALNPKLCPVHCDSKRVCYAMKCVHSAPGFVAERLDAEFYKILDGLSEADATKALYDLCKAIPKNLFCNPTEQLKEIAELDAGGETMDLDDSHAFIKRIVVTPTGIRFYEPEYTQVSHSVCSMLLVLTL